MLIQLLENVGLAQHQPPPPKGGIPRQWFPSPLRWLIRLVVFPLMCLDLGAQWIAKKIIRPPYIQKGRCKQRGNCCHYILVRKTRWLPRCFDLFWHTQINGFFLRDQRVQTYYGMSVYVMGCRHLSKGGRCCNRPLRPAICRTWPRIEIFGRPELLKGCGFVAYARQSKGTFVPFGSKQKPPTS